MAGHSKWANIQHRKGRQDARRAKIWTRLIREIQVAARDAGPDPETNPRLRLSLERAAAANMQKDNIERDIQRVEGLRYGITIEEIRDEGYRSCCASCIV